MQFKHKDLLNEFNRQVQYGEYEKGWWRWECSYCPGAWRTMSLSESPCWNVSLEYRYSKTKEHPDNALLDVGDVVQSWYFTAVVAKISNKDDNSEKYFAVIIANEGTYGKASSDYIGQLLDQVVVETREQITECFDGYEVIKKKPE